VKLPFEKLVQALRNFPEGALQPDTLLPLAYNIKVPMACHSLFFIYLPLPNFCSLIPVFICCSLASECSIIHVRQYTCQSCHFADQQDYIVALARSLVDTPRTVWFSGVQEAGGATARI